MKFNLNYFEICKNSISFNSDPLAVKLDTRNEVSVAPSFK